MWESLGPLALVFGMVVGLWRSLQTGRLYTRRSYLDLRALMQERIDDRDERIADLKESIALLRGTVKEREEQVSILLAGHRRAEP